MVAKILMITPIVATVGWTGRVIFAQITNTIPGTGTSSMQYLMLAAIGCLGGVIAYLHRDNKKDNAVRDEDHKKVVADLVDRLDKRETAMGVERTARIDMLMKRMEEDTEAKNRVALTNKDVAHAIDNNTVALKELRELVKEFLDDQRRRAEQSTT